MGNLKEIMPSTRTTTAILALEVEIVGFLQTVMGLPINLMVEDSLIMVAEA